MAWITPNFYSHAFFVSLSLVTGLLCAEHTFLAKQAYFPQGGNLRPLPYDLRYANPIKTAVRLGPISPITGWPIKIIHELRRFLRLLLLNINYLRYYFYQNRAEKNMDFEHPT